MTRDQAISLALRCYPPEAQLLYGVLSRQGANAERPVWLLLFGLSSKVEGRTKVVSSSVLIDDQSGETVGEPEEWG